MAAGEGGLDWDWVDRLDVTQLNNWDRMDDVRGFGRQFISTKDFELGNRHRMLHLLDILKVAIAHLMVIDEICGCPTIYGCPFCAKRFAGVGYLNEHVAARHGGRQGSPGPYGMSGGPLVITDVPRVMPSRRDAGGSWEQGAEGDGWGASLLAEVVGERGVVVGTSKRDFLEGLPLWVPESCCGRRIPIESKNVFRSGRIHDPVWLGDASAPGLKKDARRCFECIRTYCGLRREVAGLEEEEEWLRARTTALVKLARAAVRVPELADEVFFQLLRQSRVNAREQATYLRQLKPLFELFVVVSTVAEASAARKDVLDGLYAFFEHPLVGEHATLSAMRIDRCPRPPCRPVGEPTTEALLEVLRRIPGESASFGMPLCEQLWRQRGRHAQLLVPATLFCLVRELGRKGCERRRRLFRHEGNAQRVQQMIDAFNEGRDVAAGAHVDDLAAVLVRWLQALPDGIPAHSSGSASAIVEQCTRQYAVTLRFLVGFLQRIVRKSAEAGTDNGARDIALVIGPVLMRGRGDGSMLTRVADRGVMLLEELLAHLPPDDVYAPCVEGNEQGLF